MCPTSRQLDVASTGTEVTLSAGRKVCSASSATALSTAARGPGMRAHGRQGLVRGFCCIAGVVCFECGFMIAGVSLGGTPNAEAELQAGRDRVCLSE